VTAEKLDGRYVAHVTASCEVIFLESCPFEQQIKTKSTSTIADIVKSWCTMATEALKLTEKAKLNRLQRSELDDDDDTTDFENLNDDDTDAPTTEAPPADHTGVEVVARHAGEAYALTPTDHQTFLVTPSKVASPPPPTRPLASVRRSLSQLKQRAGFNTVSKQQQQQQ